MGLFAGQPPTVNSRGDTLSRDDFGTLEGDTLSNLARSMFDPDHKGLKLTPQQRSDMLLNWLNAGGKPDPVDPGKMFGEAQAGAGVRAKAAAGSGISGLFGMGKMIGELAPMPALPTVEGVKPMKPIQPLNQSPMQPGVPYSAIPLPAVR